MQYKWTFILTIVCGFVVAFMVMTGNYSGQSLGQWLTLARFGIYLSIIFLFDQIVRPTLILITRNDEWVDHIKIVRWRVLAWAAVLELIVWVQV